MQHGLPPIDWYAGRGHVTITIDKRATGGTVALTGTVQAQTEINHPAPMHVMIALVAVLVLRSPAGLV